MKSVKSKCLLWIIVSGLVAFVVVPVIAMGPADQAGKSNTGLLYLHEKDAGTWEIVESGANGKMKYNLSGSTFNFVFNGHGLEPAQEYALVYYPDPWPGNGLIILGGPVAANKGGNVHIQGSVDTGDLPADYDDNAQLAEPGTKIWLVLADDIAITNKMVGWHPAKYLFEQNLITFDDTDE